MIDISRSRDLMNNIAFDCNTADGIMAKYLGRAYFWQIGNKAETGNVLLDRRNDKMEQLVIAKKFSVGM